MKRIVCVALCLFLLLSGCQKEQEPTLVTSCLEVLPYNPQTHPLPGKLILKGSGMTYSIDMESGVKSTFFADKNIGGGNFTVSPNGEWIAYVQYIKGEPGNELLRIASFTGKESLTYSINYDEWQDIAYWLNDNTLVLWNHAVFSGDLLDSIVLFNPFTNEKELMPNNYPNMLYDGYTWGKVWPSVTFYSPTLEQVIYLKEPPKSSEFYTPDFILWDRTKGQVVTEIKEFGLTFVYPQWDLAGNNLVFVKSSPDNDFEKDEIYSLTTDGVLKQLTRLSDLYTKVFISSLQRSPDGKFVAFHLREGGNYHLMILNISSLQLTDYCLKPGLFMPFYWSQDSRYVAFAQELATADDTQTVVLDIQEGAAFVVDPDSQPQGWMKK